MKTLLSLIFILFFSFGAFGQSSCPVTLSQNYASFNWVNINSVAIDVTAADNCTWTAARSDSWVGLNGSETQTVGTATFSGTGSGRFYILAVYNDGDPRQTSVTVNNQTIAVSQRAGCNYTVRDFDQSFIAAGGTRTYPAYQNNGGPYGCKVVYTTDAEWIHLGATDYTVDANTGAARTGRIIYNYGNKDGTNFRVLYVSINQAAGMPAPPANCTYSFNPQLIPASGGLIDYGIVKNNADCNIVVRAQLSNPDWVHGYTADANPGEARSGFVYFVVGSFPGVPPSLTNGSPQVSVTQQAKACTYTINPDIVPAFGGTINLNIVKNDSRCVAQLSPGSSSTFITGDTVDANYGPERTGVVKLYESSYIGGQIGLGTDNFVQLVSIYQASGCTFTPSQTADSIAAIGGDRTFTIQANGDCEWYAVSQSDWITVNLGTNWSGSGTVGYTVAPNATSYARTGTITVAGQTFTITQAGVPKSRKRVRVF